VAEGESPSGQDAQGQACLRREGGYNLQGLRDSVKAVLKELRGEITTKDQDWSGKEDKRILAPVIDKVKEIHSRYWKI